MAVSAQGFVGGDYDAAATAPCPKFPGGLELRVNGQTLLVWTRDAGRAPVRPWPA